MLNLLTFNFYSQSSFLWFTFVFETNKFLADDFCLDGARSSERKICWVHADSVLAEVTGVGGWETQCPANSEIGALMTSQFLMMDQNCLPPPPKSSPFRSMCDSPSSYFLLTQTFLEPTVSAGFSDLYFHQQCKNVYLILTSLSGIPLLHVITTYWRIKLTLIM